MFDVNHISYLQESVEDGISTVEIVITGLQPTFRMSETTINVSSHTIQIDLFSGTNLVMVTVQSHSLEKTIEFLPAQSKAAYKRKRGTLTLAVEFKHTCRCFGE